MHLGRQNPTWMDQQHLHLGVAVLTQQSNDKAANTTWLPPHSFSPIMQYAREIKGWWGLHCRSSKGKKNQPRSVHWLLVFEVLGQGKDKQFWTAPKSHLQKAQRAEHNPVLQSIQYRNSGSALRNSTPSPAASFSVKELATDKTLTSLMQHLDLLKIQGKNLFLERNK